MNKHIILFLLLLLAPLALNAQQTLYVIDNVTVDKFDGSQLKGKTIRDYKISTTGSGRKAVTVHSITTGPATVSFSGFNLPSYSREELEKLRLQIEGFHLKADSLQLGERFLKLNGDTAGILYVIDGERVEGAVALQSVKPTDIGSISVLKAAESRKKYGFDGTVIEIQTRTKIKDLLDQMPGVKLSKDGTITVNGEKVKSITINGQKYSIE